MRSDKEAAAMTRLSTPSNISKQSNGEEEPWSAAAEEVRRTWNMLPLKKNVREPQDGGGVGVRGALRDW